jgi:hypothetical protein
MLCLGRSYTKTVCRDCRSHEDRSLPESSHLVHSIVDGHIMESLRVDDSSNHGFRPMKNLHGNASIYHKGSCFQGANRKKLHA